MLLAISVIIPQLMLILLGNGLKRMKQFPKSFWSSLEGLVFYVLFPPLLFQSVAKAKINYENCVIFLIVAVGCMLTAVFLSWLINKFYSESHWTKWSVFHCGFRFNTYIGFAVCQPLLGNEGFALLSLLISIWVPISNTIAVLGLTYASQEKARITVLDTIIKVFKNPLIIATLLGLAFNILHLQLPDFINVFLKFLGNASLTLGLLCIGAGLAFSDFRKYRSMILLCTFERLVLVPAVALLCGIFLMPVHIQACVLLLFASLPTAQSCYVMTAKMNGNGGAVADLTSFQTVVSMVTIPIWLSLMLHYFPI